MKNLYFLLLFFLTVNYTIAQGYTFGIVHNSDYNFSVVAIPDFDVTDSDLSDVGFTLMLPEGDANLENLTQFNARTWDLTEVTAIQLTGLGIGDGTRDAFVLVLPPGQTILSHTTGNPITLLTFDISNMPTTGQMELLPNDDPIAIGLSGAANSFYNSNIDNTTTQDYFAGFEMGQESYSFSTLSTETLEKGIDYVSLYPNPTSETFSVSSNVEIETIEIYDVLGKNVLTSSKSKTIEIRHLDTGLYLLKIKTASGNITKKLVVE
ncbi:MAG: T9SS type A sorting domain-containing protein [Winogradskyella sp.]|nr:T9SS type A sorting domain-containing protein [Winogradskyella sp.]